MGMFLFKISRFIICKSKILLLVTAGQETEEKKKYVEGRKKT